MHETEATPTPEPEPRAVVLLTAAEVALILQLKSARSVYKLARRHRWSFQRTLGHRTVRYERRGLLAWIKRRPTRSRTNAYLPMDSSAHLADTLPQRRVNDDA